MTRQHANGYEIDPFIGTITACPTSIPVGFLECNGAAISRTTYAALFAVLSVNFGAGDGSTTFNIPDLRGEFIRGFNNASGNDPDAASRTDRGDGATGDNIGTKQADEFKSHFHPVPLRNVTANTIGTSSMSGGAPDLTRDTDSTGGNESRPRNVQMLFCIKY